jgi:arylamine N-acetyltransferase
MFTSPLSPSLTCSVLRYLDVPTPITRDVAFLDTLIGAYIRRIPWESATRIIKRARESYTHCCPRLPQEFWESAMIYGTGGTCFESNYAFLALLRALGYEAYLTINDMDMLRACHSALVVTVGHERWLVDVGLPLHIALPLDFMGHVTRRAPLHSYTVVSCGDLCYEITRDNHPKPYCFTLIDQPISDEDYRAAIAADYGSSGLFLDRVIISRVIDDEIWRFYAQKNSATLDSFKNGCRTKHTLGDDPAPLLTQIFDMDESIIKTALAITMGIAPAYAAC